MRAKLKCDTVDRMTLKELMKVLTHEEKHSLARRAETDYIYLFQCAGTGPNSRRPSPALAKRLVAADPRLTLAELRPDIWGDEPALADAGQGK